MTFSLRALKFLLCIQISVGAEFQVFRNIQVSETGFASYSTSTDIRTVTRCATICSGDSRCRMFLFKKSDFTCQITNYLEQSELCSPSSDCRLMAYKMSPSSQPSTICLSEFEMGDVDGIEVKWTNMDVYACAKRCLEEGGSHITVVAGINTGTHLGDCWCEKGPVAAPGGSGTTYKHSAIGFCNECYGSFIVGDPNGSEVKWTGLSTRACAVECLRHGGNYITLLNNGVNPSDYVGDCWCETGVTSIDGVFTAYRAAPIVCQLDDL